MRPMHNNQIPQYVTYKSNFVTCYTFSLSTTTDNVDHHGIKPHYDLVIGKS
jgi:hypothetical protein